MQIPLITSLIHYFKVVYSYAGKKLYVLLSLFLLGGLAEGVGVAMLLPILSVDEAESDQGQYTKTIYNFLESIGISVSLFSLIMLLLIAFLLKGTFMFLQKTLASYINLSLIRNVKLDFCDKYKNLKSFN